MMASADFYLGQDDLLPSLETILRDENDEAIDLSSYDPTMVFRMRLVDKSRPAIVSTAENLIIGDPLAATGAVRHDWAAVESSVPGLYIVSFTPMIAGKPETFSNAKKSTLWIDPRV